VQEEITGALEKNRPTEVEEGKSTPTCGAEA